MGQLHVIHSRGGRIANGADTTPADVDAIAEALKGNANRHLVLHFHGGLVSRTAGMALAHRLLEHYKPSSHPVFYVWESGFFEAIRNNLQELADEPVFKQLVRKLLEYALERLGAQGGGRSIAPGSVDARRVRDTVDRFWAHPSRDNIPYRGFDPIASPTVSRSAATTIRQDDVQADLERDAEFRFALATLPDVPPGTRSTLTKAVVQEHRSGFSEAVSEIVSERPGTRGLITWYKVAVLVKNILVKVIRRYSAGRDHGLYATVMEEIVREVKLGGSGLNEWGKALQWNRMKQDTADAFGPDENAHAGTALLARLKAALESGARIDRITLIGHSTGAIYIAHWLAKAHQMLPEGVKFDVLFLAPAITYDLFDDTIAAYAGRIENFRMFCMRDALERDDQVWGDDVEIEDGQDLRRFIYPSSLLYLVSGILESREGDDGRIVDEPDMPLLGMERYYAMTDVYGGDDFPAVTRVRKWLDSQPKRMVWTKSEGQPDGLNSGSFDHGGFDNDEATLASIAAVLKGW